MIIRLTLRRGNLTNTGQRYTALLGERALCSSRQPFFDAARVLQAEGVPPDTVLEASHEGSATVAMCSTVGEAAQWAISEGDKSGLHKRQWRPFDENRGADHTG